MRAKISFAILTVGILVCFVAAPLAGAETMKGRIVFHYVKVEVIQVGDVAGHVIGVAEARGLYFDDIKKEVGTYSNRVMFDYINGSGTHWGYDLRTYEDGSTMVTKFEGTTMAGEGGISSFKGTGSFIKGTGRYEGIQGGTSYAGKRLAPLTPGGPADCYADFTGSYTVPGR